MPAQSAPRPLLIRLAGLVALVLLVAVLGACGGDDDGGGGTPKGGSQSGSSNKTNDSNESSDEGGGGASGDADTGGGSDDDGSSDDDGGGGGGGGGDGGDRAEAFCNEVKAALVSDNRGGGDVEQQAERFKDAIAKLQKIDPPDEIAKDWNAVVGLWSSGGAEKVDIQAAQKSSQRIGAYMRDECNVTGR